jgi:hypothetical protein
VDGLGGEMEMEEDAGLDWEGEVSMEVGVFFSLRKESKLRSAP